MKTISRLPLVGLIITIAMISVVAETERTYVVEPGGYNSIEWNFEKPTMVSARFRARGGRGNDIEVYIFDEDGVENWRNGHQAPTYYNSRRVTVGRFNLRLGPGKYFLVMSNRFSSVSNKVVIFNFF